MTKEEKKEYKKTNEYKFKRSKVMKILSICEEWISILSPFCVMLGINWNNWIKTNEDKYSIALGLVLALIMTAFAIYKKFKSEMKLGYLFWIVGWWVATLCLLFLNKLIQDLVYIMIYTGIGLLVSLIGKYGENYYTALMKQYAPEAKNKNTNSKLRSEAFKDLLRKKGKDDEEI